MDNLRLDYLIGKDFVSDNKYFGKIEQINRVTKNLYAVYIKTKKATVLRELNELSMLMLYKDTLIREERANILDERGVDYLLHFTKVENLESIFQSGLLSKNILDQNNVDYLNTDDERIDGKPDFICTSIEYPNYKMFYPKRCELPGQEWGILILDKNIMIHRLDTEFYETNAASNAVIDMDHTSNEALSHMFYENNRDEDLKSYYPTDPQAEVLVKDMINKPYILSLHINKENKDIKDMAKNYHVDCDVNDYYFWPRSDYRKWQR